MKKVLSFVKNESGAVTVDWVVLTAGVVGLAVIVAAAFAGIGTDLNTLISTAIATPTVTP